MEILLDSGADISAAGKEALRCLGEQPPTLQPELWMGLGCNHISAWQEDIHWWSPYLPRCHRSTLIMRAAKGLSILPESYWHHSDQQRTPTHNQSQHSRSISPCEPIAHFGRHNERVPRDLQRTGQNNGWWRIPHITDDAKPFYPDLSHSHIMTNIELC